MSKNHTGDWIVRLAVTASLIGAAGCHNRFMVKVEKLAVSSSRTNDDADRALATVYDALSGLDTICLECRAAYPDEAFDGSLAPLAETQTTAGPLLALAEELMGRRGRGELTGRTFAAQVSALGRRVREIMPDGQTAAFEQLIAAEPDEYRRAAMRSISLDLVARLGHFTAKLDLLDTTRPGFGGFRQAGVYRINPGDPAYDAVLRADAIGHPLTSVDVRATGDTGIMIVQESPGQLRLYQLTNDPITLMRNASFILDKVMQAAVKFGAVGGL